jgi:hypothetical protein
MHGAAAVEGIEEDGPVDAAVDKAELVVFCKGLKLSKCYDRQADKHTDRQRTAHTDGWVDGLTN